MSATSFPTTLCQILLKDADMLGNRLFDNTGKAWEAAAAFQRTCLVARFETALKLFLAATRLDVEMTKKEIDVLRSIHEITKEEVMGIISDKIIRIIEEKNSDANLRAIQALTGIMKNGLASPESNVGRILQELMNERKK